jgi:hypothetical protein
MDQVKNIGNMAQEYSKKIMNSKCYLIIVYLLSIVFIIIFTYSLYLRKELTKEAGNLKEMKKLIYEDEITITQLADYDYTKQINGKKTTLLNYYVYGSVNSCCTGEVINGYVSIEALKEVINLGVRLLDFEIYFKNGQVVVAAGRNNIYMKDTYNELEIGTVFAEIKKLALGSVANKSDPLILNFRIVSKNPNVYHILEKNIMKHFSDYLVDKRLPKQNKRNEGTALTTPLENLINKVIIFVKDDYKLFEENPGFKELVNASTNGNPTGGTKIAVYNDYQIQNEGSPDAYINEAKTSFLITTPNTMGKGNSKWSMHHKCGVQGVLMNFGGGYHDDQFKNYRNKFLKEQKAFILKPVELLKRPETTFEIDEQNPKLNAGSKPVVFTIGDITIDGGQQL